jgi:hypothetical protein
MPVLPIEREGRYVFEFGSTSLKIDPLVGARVISLACAGTELLTGPDVDPLNYGSTFWPSPQADWVWPPIAEIDSGPYRGTVSGSSLSLSSAVGVRNGLSLSVTKKFTPDVAREALRIEYSIKNEGTAPQRVAPWEITRVFPNGLTFYPTGSAPVAHGPPLPATVEAAGHTWFPYDAAAVTGDQKLFADGAGGWLAHVAGDVLLVKTFADTPPAAQAPGEAEIEIYANAAKTYVEVEQQGPYIALEPGESSTWLVTWYVRKLPPTLGPRVGSTDLLAFVTQTIATAENLVSGR